MGLAQFLLLLFLLATFDRSPNNLLRLCRLVEKSQRRNRRDLVRENVIENPNEHEPETPIRAGRLRPTKHMILFLQAASNSACDRNSGWR